MTPREARRARDVLEECRGVILDLFDSFVDPSVHCWGDLYRVHQKVQAGYQYVFHKGLHCQECTFNTSLPREDEFDDDPEEEQRREQPPSKPRPPPLPATLVSPGQPKSKPSPPPLPSHVLSAERFAAERQRGRDQAVHAALSGQSDPPRADAG